MVTSPCHLTVPPSPACHSVASPSAMDDVKSAKNSNDSLSLMQPTEYSSDNINQHAGLDASHIMLSLAEQSAASHNRQQPGTAAQLLSSAAAAARHQQDSEMLGHMISIPSDFKCRVSGPTTMSPLQCILSGGESEQILVSQGPVFKQEVI